MTFSILIQAELILSEGLATGGSGVCSAGWEIILCIRRVGASVSGRISRPIISPIVGPRRCVRHPREPEINTRIVRPPVPFIPARHDRNRHGHFFAYFTFPLTFLPLAFPIPISHICTTERSPDLATEGLPKKYPKIRASETSYRKSWRLGVVTWNLLDFP